MSITIQYTSFDYMWKSCRIVLKASTKDTVFDPETKVGSNGSEKQSQQHDKTASREATIYHYRDRVGVRSFRGGREKWLWRNITKVCEVTMEGVRRCHVLISRNATDSVDSAIIPKPILGDEQAKSDSDVYITIG